MNNQMSSALAQGDQIPVVLNGADGQAGISITSVELTQLINTFRKEESNETEKQHKELMRDIRKEIEVLESVGINQSNFALVKYTDKKGETRPCYSLNKAGVLQMLNKESAVVRYKTVQYIERLEKEKQPQLMSMEDIIIYQMQQSKMLKEQVEQTKTVAIEAKEQAEQANKQMEIVKDAMLLDHDSWRKDCNNIINKIAKQRGGSVEAYKEIREEIYRFVEQRAGANLKQRITNKQDRMRREGTSKSKVDKVSQIDVIAEDKRLKEIYIAVVKEMTIKYGVA